MLLNATRDPCQWTYKENGNGRKFIWHFMLVKYFGGQYLALFFYNIWEIFDSDIYEGFFNEKKVSK
jgi:hypothetical protein